MRQEAGANLAIGTEIDGWVIAGIRHSGSAGHAYPVRRHGETEAIGSLKIERSAPDVQCGTNKREADRLVYSPSPTHMPALLAQGNWQGCDYFVEELLEEPEWPIQEPDFRPFAIDLFEGLSEIHTEFFICDIAPAHLMRKRGHGAFIDFDNAHTPAEAAKHNAAKHPRSIGTAPYIAPETASSGQLSAKADVHVLSHILLERCPPKLQDTFKPVFDLAMSIDPTKRPTAAEMVNLLKTCRAPHHRFKAVAKWVGIVTLVFLLIPALFYLGLQVIFWTDNYLEKKAAAKVTAANIEIRQGDFQHAIKNLEWVAHGKTSRKRQAEGMLNDIRHELSRRTGQTCSAGS